jgi:hypothetical protein
LPVGFEFGGRISHGETGSNKLKQQSNKFEPCLSLLEVLLFPLVAVQGKMSDGFFGLQEQKICRGVVEQFGKEGPECFG